MSELKIHIVKTSELAPYANNAKLHTKQQVEQIAKSIEEFGNCDPIAVWHNESGESEIVEGHGRLLALKKLGIEEVPVIYLDHLTDEQRRAYALVHNKLTMNSGFDLSVLSFELDSISQIDLSEYGFNADTDALDISDLLRDDDVMKAERKPKTIRVVCECCGEEFDVEL